MNTTVSRVLDVILKFILLITFIALFVVFYPIMPAADLDASWMFGVNQALAQGLSFGREVIFTYGPYAAIFTKVYSPASYLMTLSGSLYIALVFWLASIFLITRTQWYWAVFFCVTLPVGLCTYYISLITFPIRDSLFFLGPLIVGLSVFKTMLLEDIRFSKSKVGLLYVALLFSSFGILVLIKGDLVIICGAVTVLCAVFFIANKQRLLAIICLLSPLISMLFFWVISGQSILTLPNYFVNLFYLCSTYTEAMAIESKIIEVVACLLFVIYLLFFILTQKHFDFKSKIFVSFIYFIFLFISFKEGFVRHDAHEIVAGASLLIAVLLLPFIFRNKAIPPVIVGFLAWVFIAQHYVPISMPSFGKQIQAAYASMWHGIKSRLENKNWLSDRYDAAIKNIRAQVSFPLLPGTTDIYSFNQSYLIASGNVWNPRPIFQSYSAYTPELAAINKQHLLSNHAPDNIIFKVETIDERMPTIDDGASWPVLLTNYHPTIMQSDFLFLKKNDNNRNVDNLLKLRDEKHIFGENVAVPELKQPLFVQLDIEPTFLGRLATIFYKPSQLTIQIELKNGITKEYRMVAGMAKSGFLLSPLIDTTEEFAKLYPKKILLKDKLVKSFAIFSSDNNSVFWNNQYDVNYFQIKHHYK